MTEISGVPAYIPITGGERDGERSQNALLAGEEGNHARMQTIFGGGDLFEVGHDDPSGALANLEIFRNVLADLVGLVFHLVSTQGFLSHELQLSDRHAVLARCLGGLQGFVGSVQLFAAGIQVLRGDLQQFFGRYLDLPHGQVEILVGAADYLLSLDFLAYGFSGLQVIHSDRIKALWDGPPAQLHETDGQLLFPVELPVCDIAGHFLGVFADRAERVGDHLVMAADIQSAELLANCLMEAGALLHGHRDLGHFGFVVMAQLLKQAQDRGRISLTVKVDADRAQGGGSALQVVHGKMLLRHGVSLLVSDLA